jgi:flagellar L-ring protein precursor FlgH
MWPIVIALLSLFLTGCAGDIMEIGREPFMSPVGTGLIADVQPSASALFMPSPGVPKGSTIWDGGRANIFSDIRAVKIGDVITVQIAIDDRATFGNSTDRSQAGQISTGFNFLLSTMGLSGGQNNQTQQIMQFNPQVDASATSAAQGKGSIDRAEKIQLAVAAVVTDVLPNGNLIISGSQEVRVNFELRLLTVAGIVRPQDVSKENTIAYDKIAEARISYGGRGRIMEVQQPTVFQQVYDRLKGL